MLISKMAFEHDLKYGEAGEKVIKEAIRKVYPKAYKPEDDAFDLVIPETGQTVEVKTDKGSRESENIVVETASRGKPSGIYGPADLWGQVYYSDKFESWVYFITTTDKMKEFANLYGKEIVGGDEKASDLLLLKKKDIELYFSFKIKKIDD